MRNNCCNHMVVLRQKASYRRFVSTRHCYHQSICSHHETSEPLIVLVKRIVYKKAKCSFRTSRITIMATCNSVGGTLAVETVKKFQCSKRNKSFSETKRLTRQSRHHYESLTYHPTSIRVPSCDDSKLSRTYR